MPEAAIMHTLSSALLLSLPLLHGAFGAALSNGRPASQFKRDGEEFTLDDFADYTPNFAVEGNGPEPPLENDDGTPIDLQNLRGTRIFGGAGCDGDAWGIIKDSWHDFHDIVSMDGVKSNIDWNSQNAKDFWGPSTTIPQDRKDFIQSTPGTSPLV